MRGNSSPSSILYGRWQRANVFESDESKVLFTDHKGFSGGQDWFYLHSQSDLPVTNQFTEATNFIDYLFDNYLNWTQRRGIINQAPWIGGWEKVDEEKVKILYRDGELLEQLISADKFNKVREQLFADTIWRVLTVGNKKWLLRCSRGKNRTTIYGGVKLL